MSGISTHILDTSIGKPAQEVQVSLFNVSTSELLKNAKTDNDGRVGDLTTDLDLESGVYELVFDIEPYFQSQQKESFYPSVSVKFKFEKGQHYHVPLLLNPFGYSTYRGS